MLAVRLDFEEDLEGRVVRVIVGLD